MARCRPYRTLSFPNPPDQNDRGANNSWGVPDLLYNPQAVNNFLPGPRQVWEPSPGTELPRAVVAVPEGCPQPRDLLQQCLWAAGITEQLLEVEAKRDLGALQPSLQMFPVGSLGWQPLLQPFVQHPGPFSVLQHPRAQPGMAALPAPHVVFLQQVPQRIILQVKQPGPTTLALLPSPASCVLGSGQGLGPAAHPPSGHPPRAPVSPCGHQHPAAAQHSSTQAAKAVGIELWHGESFWGLQP